MGRDGQRLTPRSAWCYAACSGGRARPRIHSLWAVPRRQLGRRPRPSRTAWGPPQGRSRLGGDEPGSSPARPGKSVLGGGHSWGGLTGSSKGRGRLGGDEPGSTSPGTPPPSHLGPRPWPRRLGPAQGWSWSSGRRRQPGPSTGLDWARAWVPEGRQGCRANFHLILPHASTELGWAWSRTSITHRRRDGATRRVVSPAARRAARACRGQTAEPGCATDL